MFVILDKVVRKKIVLVEGNTKLVSSTEVVDSTMVKDDMKQHVFVFSEQSGVQP